MYNQKLAFQRPKTFLLKKSLWKMKQFDRNMMGNSQNISDTKFLSKYIQFESASSSLAQFADKWQWKRMQPSIVFFKKQWFCYKVESNLSIPCGLIFQNPICQFKTNKIGLKCLPGTFFRIGLSFLEAEIWRFLWCHFVGYSLYLL